MKHEEMFRMLDANLNRSREGMRVVEDYFRFISENDMMRKKIRKIRHSLSDISSDRKLVKELAEARDVQNDSGKNLDILEAKREDIFDIVYANFQRAKESLRVIEELLKILGKKKVETAKKIRYKIYDAEKYTFKNWPYLYNTGQKNNR